MIYYITGGARSGKSSYAMKLAKKLSDTPIYLATARTWDKDFQKRIDRHTRERDHTWTTIEEETAPGKLDFKKNVVVIDCVTLWLTNLFVDSKNDIESSLEHFKHQVDLLQKKEATFIIISNELGMGMHAETESGRKFTDLQGWANQYVASQADHCTFMVSGLPLELKSQKNTHETE